MMKIRKMFYMLGAALLLSGCYEVDEFSKVTPDSITLDRLVSVSDLTYDELDALVTDELQRENLRRGGGLLVCPTVHCTASYQGYDLVGVCYSDQADELPPVGYLETALSSWEYLYDYGQGTDWLCIDWQDSDYLMAQLPGKTIYCIATVQVYGGEWPGFVDDVLEGGDEVTESLGPGYVGSNGLYSDVKSYRYPDAPLPIDCAVDGGYLITAHFHVVLSDNQNLASEVRSRGICYSTTNPLPDMGSNVAVVDEMYYGGPDAMVDVEADAGSYYVRIFVEGVHGEVAYSPVFRVEVEETR